MMCKLADNVKWKISLRPLLMRAFREPVFFFQQATRVALSTKQSTLALETKQATLCKTYRRANASFTTMGRLVGQKMPPQPEPEVSEKTSNWKCFSSFHGKNPDQKSRKRRCLNSAFKSGETGIALGCLLHYEAGHTGI